MKTTKLKIGFYGITGCAGCQLSFIFNEDELLSLIDLIDLRAFPFIKEFNLEEKFDYVFIEGLVANKNDLKTLKKLREKADKLVALGACAHTGCVPAYRNFTLKENYKHLLYMKRTEIQDVKPTPVDTHVNVDYTIPGCPPDKNEIMNFIKDIVKGKEPKINNNPVCVECRRNNNVCLLDVGKPCLGPITRGGCNSVCTNGKFECWGCRGLTDDADIKLLVKLLKEKGFSEKIIKQRMRSFVGLKLPNLEKIMNE
ncbi:sulfhydrogenase 1 subunit delta [Candidatus Woesearchaeota archaeon]|nr:sulfhydrogenase 1 subunit delta [Candidatus Woesearchaeota archaeon]